MSKPKLIAFYLPQYHPTPDNDKWWGKGFTEWTNVGKAKPLFHGHYQPKIPADLGYYDLRLPEVREQQAQLAKEAGVYGFCYYHYWFGNGREQLEMPFDEVLKTGKPDFPFMLCWANESWHRKFWNKDGKGSSKELLIEQLYPGEEDTIAHFYRLLPAFKDSRYIRIDNKPAFMIYKPLNLPNQKRFTAIWNKLAIKEGLEGIYFIAHLQPSLEEIQREEKLLSEYKSFGYSAINILRLFRVWNNPHLLCKIINRISRSVLGRPITVKYKNIIPYLTSSADALENVFPTIIPNWDHTPRSGSNGTVLLNSSPELFDCHVQNVMEMIGDKNNNVVFLKSWNEWGEGNYVEPDMKFGHGYLNVIKRYFTAE